MTETVDGIWHETEKGEKYNENIMSGELYNGNDFSLLILIRLTVLKLLYLFYSNNFNNHNGFNKLLKY